MASSLNASTSGGGGVIVTSDATGNLNIQSGGSTVVAVTSTGVAVTGTLAATGAITGSSTVAGSTGILYPLTSGTAVASTSGTSIDFTSIPSWVKRITVMFDNVSTSGASIPMVQLGDSGGIETTGYAGSVVTVSTVAAASLLTTGVLFQSSAYSAAFVANGAITFSLINSATNTWAFVGSIGQTTGGQLGHVAGLKPLSSTLDRIRLTTVNGTDTFDAGSINILYE